VHAIQECWLSATADGERVIDRTLSAGETARESKGVKRSCCGGWRSAPLVRDQRRERASPWEVVMPSRFAWTPNNYREYLSSQTSTERNRWRRPTLRALLS
jgi:hypothetical protein